MSTNAVSQVNPGTGPAPVVKRSRFALRRWSPELMLAILLLSLALVIGSALAISSGWAPVQSFRGPVGGVLPLAAIWAGALGGLSNAIYGLTKNWALFYVPNSTQGTKWNAWYLVQLPLGAVFGSFAVLIVVFFVGSVAVTSEGKPNLSTSGVATMAVIAYAVGFRQETFRQLITRVFDVILGPGTKEPPAPGLATTETAVAFDKVRMGDHLVKTVHVTNRGTTALNVPRSAITLADSTKGFTVANGPGVLAPGESKDFNVVFQPTSAGPVDTELTIGVPGASAVVKLSGEGDDGGGGAAKVPAKAPAKAPAK
jgi:hypothetical protein